VCNERGLTPRRKGGLEKKRGYKERYTELQTNRSVRLIIRKKEGVREIRSYSLGMGSFKKKRACVTVGK